MRAAGRNLGFTQMIKIGTFQSVGTGQSLEFIFNGMPDVAPGGNQYEVLDIILRFPTGAIQIAVGAGQILTARTLWSVFKRIGIIFGANSPQAKMFGPTTPEAIMRALPGVLAADFFALSSRSRLVDVNGKGVYKRSMGTTAALKSEPVMVSTLEFSNDGYAWQHGPYGAGQNFGATEQVDFYFPLGRRASPFGMEDFDDASLPAHWLHGKPVKGSGVEFESCRLQLDMNTIAEGGAALTLTAGITVQVWAQILVRREGRASLPNLPVCRWFAPPGNSTDVSFYPGFHFWSGFGRQDTVGNGQCDANYNVLTQTFDTIAVRQGDAYANYASAQEYLSTLTALHGTEEQGRRYNAWGNSDDPINPQCMAVVRERMGIFPVAIPKPLLLGDGSDQFNEFVISYTTPTPTNPYQLQSLYPLHTAESSNIAARSSGIPNAMVVDAIDSQLPESGLSAILPKAIRKAA